MNALVGYTGFVGSNLYENGQFDKVYNTKNIEEAYGTEPDLLVYSGLRAEKFLANKEPEKDYESILEAQKNIQRIRPKKLVLISTIDVFKNPQEVNENSNIDITDLHPYGMNRYKLECWVRENYNDALIIRLPGLFGKNIKKNFIYDFINWIPAMLKEDKFIELSVHNPRIKEYYIRQENGFYKVRDLDSEGRDKLIQVLEIVNFNALHFTDSRSTFQFYPLYRLWSDIQIALEHEIFLWHPATEPISAEELYRYLTGNDFMNELPAEPAKYDYKTLYAELYGGNNNYICSKEMVLQQIKVFVEQERKKL